MRYQIAKKDYSDLIEKQKIALKHMEICQQYGDFNRFRDVERCCLKRDALSFVYVCKRCGAELYGEFWKPQSYFSSAERDVERAKDDYLVRTRYDSSRDNKKISAYEQAIEHFRETESLERSVRRSSEADYKNAISIKTCPICNAVLSQEKGFFLPDWGQFSHSISGMVVNEDKNREAFKQTFGVDWAIGWTRTTCNQKFDAIAPLREPTDRAHAKEEVAAYTKSCDLFMVKNAQTQVSEIKTNSDQLKKYILHLIHLENNIYSLEQQLSELYYQRVHNNRSVVLSVHEPAYMIKAELEELRSAYQKAVEAIGDAEAYQPEISVAYPVEPTAPVLGKPGLFNKKKVMEENEALTAKYQAEMDAYRKEVQRCDDEKARLIAEKRAAVLTEAQEKADAAKAALDEAERGMDDKIKALEARPIPAKAVKEVLDKEIAEAEDLLKKTFAARNELYAFDIIFGKYRNAVALSSFYEYLMSGRCTSLEGADGAYNIYESEIRANRVIAQLDTVISSLEDIKQNQYMMYEELCSINSSLDSLNYTMDAALKSIRGIEANTNHMSEYMEHISKNSDVVAHNTAVTAYYSKVNAQLTNALGYMVAFK